MSVMQSGSIGGPICFARHVGRVAQLYKNYDAVPGKIWLSNVACTGGETHLFNCSHGRYHHCGHSEDVSISCYNGSGLGMLLLHWAQKHRQLFMLKWVARFMRHDTVDLGQFRYHWYTCMRLRTILWSFLLGACFNGILKLHFFILTTLVYSAELLTDFSYTNFNVCHRDALDRLRVHLNIILLLPHKPWLNVQML